MQKQLEELQSDGISSEGFITGILNTLNDKTKRKVLRIKNHNIQTGQTNRTKGKQTTTPQKEGFQGLSSLVMALRSCSSSAFFSTQQ